MPDDILDAAQKAINDAAKSAEGPAVAPPVAQPSDTPPFPTPPEPPPPEPLVPNPAPAANEPPAEPAQPPANNAAPHQTQEEVMSALLGGNDIIAAPPAASEPHNPTVPAVPHKGTPPLTPQKKNGKGIILGMIAILLLTLPIAVYYISQQNQQLADLRGRAWLTGYQECSANGGNDDGQGTCSPGYVCHCQDGTACTETRCEPKSQTRIPCQNQGRAWCDNAFGNGWTCCVEGYVCGPNNKGCIPGTPPGGNKPPPKTPTSTPTPTTAITPVCQNIKIYKNGQQVTNLSSLRAGDTVTLAIKGNLAPTKAHFRVNGQQLAQNDGDNESGWTVTTTKNSANEWTKDYTIPEGVTDFVIEGEVFTNGAYR